VTGGATAIAWVVAVVGPCLPVTGCLCLPLVTSHQCARLCIAAVAQQTSVVVSGSTTHACAHQSNHICPPYPLKHRAEQSVTQPELT
jgi:hypothetical protein